jgi:hypothetical protein
MKFETIVNNVAHSIKLRQERAGIEQISLPVTFTHEHKIAAGCVVFVVAPDGSYEAKDFDQRYPDIDPEVQRIYHAAYFECDDDLEKKQDLIDEVAKALE